MKSLKKIYQMHTIFPRHRRKTTKTVLCFSELEAPEMNYRKLTAIMTSSVRNWKHLGNEFPETDSYNDKLCQKADIQSFWESQKTTKQWLPFRRERGYKNCLKYLPLVLDIQFLTLIFSYSIIKYFIIFSSIQEKIRKCMPDGFSCIIMLEFRQ